MLPRRAASQLAHTLGGVSALRHTRAADAKSVRASFSDSPCHLETSDEAAADPVAEVSPPSGETTESEPSSRTTTMTSEFQFRTGKDVNVWPGRILFLVIGLLLGGGGVYYAAWYGLLPGILY